MIFILKIILCSSLLIAVYYLFMQKEKMYAFNRFYLIFSLLFSYTVPFISIKSETPKPSNRFQTTIEATQDVLDLSSGQESFNPINLIWIIYGTVTLVLLTKTIFSILKIKKIKGEKIIYKNQTVVLADENISPFSFWNTIYLGKNHLINNQIDPRIFLHEKSHIDQKHSIDLLFIEILKIFTWFNPSLYFYKKTVVINHEFLADESVIKKKFNIKDYQHLILDEIISQKNYDLTHTFNFNNTKKRFIMMNTKKSKLTNFKKAISFPVLLVAFGLFVQKTHAENRENATDLIPEVSEKIFENKVENLTEKEKESSPEKNSIVKELKDNLANKSQDTIRPNNERSASTSSEIMQNKNDSNSEETTVAQYPGGPNELRNKVAKLFDGSKMNEKNQKTMRTEINYIVDETGKVIDITATGNDEVFSTEAVSAFKKANENIVWKPAEKDGKPVRYQMKLPLTMSFQ